MAGLRTVVLIKQVPAAEQDSGLDERGRLRRDGGAAEMNPWCRRAVTRAVELAAGGGHSTAVTMGPASARDVLREALACGADAAVHVTDRRLAGADCLVTAQALAAAIRQAGGADVVLVGRSSVDGSTGAIGPMVAELLSVPFTGPALDLEFRPDGDGRWLHARLQLESGQEEMAVALPAVVAVAERSCRAARAPVEDWPTPGNVRTVTAGQLGCEVNGADSPTRVTGTVGVSRTRRGVVLRGDLGTQVSALVDVLRQRNPEPPRQSRATAGLSWSDGPRIVVLAEDGHDHGARALCAEADRLAGEIGGHVAVVLGAGPVPRGVAGPGVVLGGTEPRRVAAAVEHWLGAAGTPPWAVLGGAGEWEREVLGRLGVRFGTGLLSDLTGLSVRASGGGALRLLGLKPAGNGVLAQVECVGTPQLATVRTGQLPAPAGFAPDDAGEVLAVSADARVRRLGRTVEDDADAVERAEVVIGVGAGVDPADYRVLEGLRSLMGAQFAATRKVTDAGRLPHGRQVGVTARGIAPRCYLALGVSGSGYHMAGVARAGTVIAVNHDPSAPIFAQADLGIVADWRTIAPLLAVEFAQRAGTGEDRAAPALPA
ncbi:FAD-binding protein [Amycolatopsis saalfeldensis]|uniref:Electron transfer flavoprotein small subunit n=1 Tax=Amycolatopsis saalfeldensis TaxID=394193 RepID=A0A1H8U1F7_9PSEU|nr:FAD-binding protein [Amycolatopsis saalfeldensis]SEO97100.1 Electron transfer flavoprotein, alpha subunit [Amycolatopsis saalfeldensis]